MYIESGDLPRANVSPDRRLLPFSREMGISVPSVGAKAENHKVRFADGKSMLQDIQPRRFDNTFRQKEPSDRDYALAMRGGDVLLREHAEHDRIPLVGDVKAAQTGAGPEFVFLFSVDDVSFFLAVGDVAPPPGYAYVDARVFRQMEPVWLAFAGATATHLGSWYAKNRFCGTCATAMMHKADERAMLCPGCGAVVYPTISPAVIVGVTDGDRLLVTRYANRPGSRGIALVAGFMEIGETLEETVRREVMEEVGVRVGEVRYYKSQPWAFSCSMLVGFFAELDGSPELTVDTGELEDAEWIERKDIPPVQSTISLTATMIEAFRTGEVR